MRRDAAACQTRGDTPLGVEGQVPRLVGEAEGCL